MSADELDNARKAPLMLAYVYEGQLDTVARIEERRVLRQAAERAEAAWSGFKEAPPYSMLLLDDVQEEVDKHREALALLQSSRSIVSVEAARFHERSTNAQEAARRAADALRGATPGTDASTRAGWRLAVARDTAQLAEALVATSALIGQELDEKLATVRAELRLAERKLAALAGKVRISKADVDQARERLNAARAQRQKQLDVMVAAAERETHERNVAQRALDKLGVTGTDVPPAAESGRALRIASARLRAAEARLQNVGQQSRVLSVFVAVYYPMALEAWDLRYAVLEGAGADVRQQARSKLGETVSYMTSWLKGLKVRQSEARAMLQDQQARTDAEPDPEVKKYELQALQALQQFDLAVESYQATIARRLMRLGHWQREFDEAVRASSVGEIALDVLAQFKVVAAAFWNYELLTIEDTTEIGGQKVTTTRGITVGKSLGAVLLFLIGYRLMRWLSFRMEGLLVRRFSVGPEQGKTLRRWADALGVFVLLLITLNLARIPITVFAFAGGALAIGIGFGTQTLIKNLISGIILLVERQIKVGDFVDVEGIIGRVIEVNIRSSTVRGFDGVETMVPNSLLLEQKVTNWTLSNRQVRRVVKVGVAYGSPVRQVAEVLADCAARHGLVLKEPAPRVIFEDFGDSALVFAVYFWVEITPDGSTMQIMSDLRFMIEKQLAEAGIVVAFPQRDIHLDASRPLKVEMVPPGAAATADVQQATALATEPEAKT